MRTDSVSDVVVAGAGLIGLVTAWRAAQRGLRVTFVAPKLDEAASNVAAGMLTPATEATFGEESLMRLGALSRERYTDFVTELEGESGESVGYRPEGTLQIAFDNDDLAKLTELGELQTRLGMKAERLTARECRRLEPRLAPSVRGGLFASEDHSVDPRSLVSALRVAAERRGAVGIRDRASEVIVESGHARGLRLESGGVVYGDQTVLAAGVWTGNIGGLPEKTVPTLRPVKGQLLRLRMPPSEPLLVSRTVRGLVKGTPVYLVPRANGEIVLGATQEELGCDTRLTVGGMWQILRDAHELVPGVSELEIAETCVGLRPGSPDNGPVLGPTRITGLHLATGHFRHGVLFTPVTGDALSEVLTGGELPQYAREFAATRDSEEERG